MVGYERLDMDWIFEIWDLVFEEVGRFGWLVGCDDIGFWVFGFWVLIEGEYLSVHFWGFFFYGWS